MAKGPVKDKAKKAAAQNALTEDYQFYFMHFMPYSGLPADYGDKTKYPSTWVELSNSHYDPEKGNALYDRYLGEFKLADKLGFDGLVVNEHHGTAYSMMASPNLIAGILARETTRPKICVWGSPPNLMYPSRLAEEYAMIDVLSKGRLNVAFPLGTGMEYWVHPVNPTTARARYRESIRLILRAWTEDSPIRHEGDFYNYRYLNTWPRPYQKPHPPCFVVGTGSEETIAFAAELGFGYSCAFAPHEAQIALNNSLRAQAAGHGHAIRSDQVPIGCMMYVAETDEQAIAEFVPHVTWFFETALRTTGRYLAPPGYVSGEQIRKRMALADKMHGHFDYNMLSQSFRVLAGSPDTVAAKLCQWMEDTGSSVVNCQLHLGDMPHWKTAKNLTLFAEEVIPRVRKARPKVPLVTRVPAASGKTAAKRGASG